MEELIKKDNSELILASDNIVAIAEQAERRISAIKKIKSIVLSVTNQSDWIDQGGKPYLQVSGAEKIARLFGISWRIDEPQIEQEPDGHYSYTYKGHFTLGDVSIEAIGARSSRDPFFSKSRGREKGIEEIDKQDVKKAALTNCIGNGITRLLGIRNLTWEELEQAGIRREKMAKVEYKQSTIEEKKEEKKETKKEDFVSIMNRERERIGDKNFFMILGNNGYERVEEITDRAEQIRIYKIMVGYPSKEALGI